MRRFRPHRHGTPAHDRLSEIFAALDAERFQQCFVVWAAATSGVAAEVIAIDGKTSRRSGRKSSDKAQVHIVSAFAARQRLVLRQLKVAEKTNEIVAIPRLLDMVSVEGAVVTIDAPRCEARMMQPPGAPCAREGCQTAIARKIIDRKADYALPLKANQGTLLQDAKVFVAEQMIVSHEMV